MVSRHRGGPRLTSVTQTHEGLWAAGTERKAISVRSFDSGELCQAMPRPGKAARSNTVQLKSSSALPPSSGTKADRPAAAAASGAKSIDPLLTLPDSELKPRRTPLDIARDAGIAFLDADVNGDQKLSWEEFQLCIPANMKENATPEELRDLFDEADADHNGTISIDEYFMWTLNACVAQAGAGLESVFRRYDRNGTGTLDEREFMQACADINFGHYAHDIFIELDHDGSGSVSYHEVIEMLRKRKGGVGSVNKTTKRFLSELSFQVANGNGDESDPLAIDTSQWQLTGTDISSLREQLSGYLILNQLRISQLRDIMLKAGGDEAFLRTNFPATMRAIGYKGEDDVLFEIFDLLDANQNGVLGREELYTWISGGACRQVIARQVTLLKGRDELTLDDIDWSPEELQRQLQLMLLYNELSPMDLLGSWDVGDKDGTLSFREWLCMMKKLVKPQGAAHIELWDLEIRPVVQETFRNISGGALSHRVSCSHKCTRSRMLNSCASHRFVWQLTKPLTSRNSPSGSIVAGAMRVREWSARRRAFSRSMTC